MSAIYGQHFDLPFLMTTPLCGATQRVLANRKWLIASPDSAAAAAAAIAVFVRSTGNATQ